MKKRVVFSSIIQALALIFTLFNLVILLEFARNPDLSSYIYLNKELPTVYLPLEQTHMYEVKLIFIVSLIVNIILLFLLRKFFKNVNFKLTGYVLLLFSGLIVLFSLLGFQDLFINFHKLIFPNSSNWLLPASSKLIQTYPLSYFRNITLVIFGVLVLIGLSLVKFNFYKRFLK